MTKKSEKNIKNTENAKNTTLQFKTEKCMVLAYNKKTKELDVNFKGYGIRLHNVENANSDCVDVKYIGEIGKANFSYKL